MWQSKLQNNYCDFDEFEHYSEMYGLAGRLGFQSTRDAWVANPVIQGSSVPSEYKIVPLWKRITRCFKYKYIGPDGCKYV